MKRLRIIDKSFIYLILVVISIVLMFPIMFLLTTALKEPNSVLTFPPEVFPKQFEWQNFIIAAERMEFFTLFKNTVLITGLSIIGTLLSCTLVAYGFARLEFRGRDFWFYVMIASMIIPAQVTLIPMYIVFRNLGWIDTFYPLVVPTFFGTPFFIFLMRQFFMTIPRQLDDAAIIDGCNPLGILVRILLPLIKPVLATSSIFMFMWTWNDFLGPVIYLQSKDLHTLSLGLYVFQDQYGTEWSFLMAATILVMLPCVLIFFFFQRYFIEGTTVTGIKG